MKDLNRLGPVLRRAQVGPEGLWLQGWYGRGQLVPWSMIKGVRIAPADRWSGKGSSPGNRAYYMVQVKLTGQWRQLGATIQVQTVPQAFAPRNAVSQESLREAYEAVHDLWVRGGGTPGDEDDNWPHLGDEVRPVG